MWLFITVPQRRQWHEAEELSEGLRAQQCGPQAELWLLFRIIVKLAFTALRRVPERACSPSSFQGRPESGRPGAWA